MLHGSEQMFLLSEALGELFCPAMTLSPLGSLPALWTPQGNKCLTPGSLDPMQDCGREGFWEI